ncbi:MAG: DUF2341 domain-containing protein, partial [Planctomycetota bacterium]
YGDEFYFGLPAGNDYYNVEFSGTGSYFLTGSMVVDGTITISGTPAYSSYESITIDHTQVGAVLTNFPILFSVTDPSLRTIANGGYVTNSNGYDIIFVDASGNKLDFEIEKYTAATGEYIAWVRIPTLSNAADTTIYLFFGNAGISTSQEDVPGTWNNNYKAVYHFNNDPGAVAPQLIDSTSNSNDGTISGANITLVNGKIGYAWDFDGGGEVSTGYTITDTYLSYYAWSNPDTAAISLGIVVGSPNYTQGMNLYWLNYGYGSALYALECGWAIYDFVDPTPGTWYQNAGVLDNGSGIIYRNGSNVAGSAGIAPITTPGIARIGGNTSGGINYFDGKMDEVRITNSALSAEWISTEYNNQNSPSTFYSQGNRVLNGIVNAGTYDVNVATNWTNSGGGAAYSGTGTVTFDGTSDQTVTTGGASFYNVAINNTGASGSDDVIISGILDVNNDLTVTDGNLDLNTNDADVNLAGDFTVEVNGSYTITDAYSATPETFTLDGTTDQALTNNNGSGLLFYNLTINNTGSAGNDDIIVMNSLALNHTFTLTDGNLDLSVSNPNITFYGDVTINGGSVQKGTGNISFTFPFVRTHTYTDNVGGINFGNINVGGANPPVNTLSLASDITLDQLVLGGLGQLVTNGYDVTTGNIISSPGWGGTIDATHSGARTTEISVSGGWLNLSTACIFIADNSTVIFNGTSNQVVDNSDGQAFYNVEINNTGASGSNNVQIYMAWDINGTLTITAGTLDLATYNPQVNIAGNVTINGGSVSKGNGNVYFDGDLIYDDNLGGSNFGNIYVGTSPDTTTLASDFTADSLTINSGDSLITSGYNLDIGTGGINISGGTLDASTAGGRNSTIYVEGNWANTGTFTASTSTVVFDGSGTSTITGSNTFNNLTCITASKTLTFAAGITQNITGTLTLNGQATGTRIVLNSSDAATRFTLNVSSSPSVYYVDVSNSNASGNDIKAYYSVDRANNDTQEASPHWVFYYNVSGLVYSDQGSTLIGSGKSITLAKNGVVQDTQPTDSNSRYAINIL